MEKPTRWSHSTCPGATIVPRKFTQMMLMMTGHGSDSDSFVFYVSLDCTAFLKVLSLSIVQPSQSK